MKRFLIFLFLVTLFSAQMNAQTDSLNTKTDTTFIKVTATYYNIECPREDADGYYFKKQPFSSRRYLKTIYSLETNKKMIEYLCYDVHYKDEDTNESYIRDIKNGKYEEWHPTGEKLLTCAFKENKLDGDYTVFYANSIIKRQERWKEGELKEGECFDEKGEKIKYFPYMENPEFKGGLTALFQYLRREIEYPEFAQQKGIEGTVYIGFVVKEDGTIADIKVKRSVEKHLDNEAMRCVAAMPKWKAGKLDGEFVRVAYTLPIKFKLK